METKPQRTLVVLHKRRTTDGKSTDSKCIIMITEKKRTNAKKTEGMPLYVRNTRKGLRRVSDQTRKGYNEESRDDNADATDRGVPLRQYDPKLICARSRFEGISTPRNEWNRRLRTKTDSNKHQGQVRLKREEENQDITRVARTRRRGYMFPSYT